MAHRLSLSKLTGKQGLPSTTPVMFRYNPCEEGIEELQPSPEPPKDQTPGTAVMLNPADRPSTVADVRPSSRDSSAERHPADDVDAHNAFVLQSVSSERVLTLSDKGTGSIETSEHHPLAGAAEVRFTSAENVGATDTSVSKVESSPVKDYFSKFGKRSSASSAESSLSTAHLAAGNEPVDARWITGLRGFITKHFEDKIHNSRPRKDDEVGKSAISPGAEKDSKTSDDNRSRAATPVDNYPDMPEKSDDVQLRRDSARDSTLPLASVDEYGHEPDLTSWEFVEQVEQPQRSGACQHVRETQPSYVISPQPVLPRVSVSLTQLVQACLQSNGLLFCAAVGVLAVVIPLPSFMSGFVVGCVISLLFFSLVWFIFVPASPRMPFEVPDYRKLPPLRVPQQSGGNGGRTGRSDVSPPLYEGWMCQLPFEAEYKIETHHMNNTKSVNLVLVGSTLRLRWPKNPVPRRAMWNEKRPEPIFVDHRHLNLSAAKVMLLPEKLSRAR